MRRSGHVDPVCGMKVDEKSAASCMRHDGESYYFCGPACRQKFEADPARYIKPAGTDGPAGSQKNQAGQYTCRCIRKCASRMPAHAQSVEWR